MEYSILKLTEYDGDPEFGDERLSFRIDGSLSPEKQQRILAILLEPSPKQKKRRSDAGTPRGPRKVVA